MRKAMFMGIVMTLVLCLILPGAVMAQKKPTTLKMGKGDAIAGYIEGTVQIRSHGAKGWHALKVNKAVQNGDEVVVGKASRLELVMPDKSRLRFAAETRFMVMQAPDAAKDDVKVHMKVGRAWANVSKTLGVQRQFELSCDNAVAGVRGTVYRMNVSDDQSALVRVYDGEVAVSGATKPMDRGEQVFGQKPTRIEGPKTVAGPHKITMEEWVVLLRSMQQVSIRADGTAEKPREFTVQEDRDEWVDWNKERDLAAER